VMFMCLSNRWKLRGRRETA